MMTLLFKIWMDVLDDLDELRFILTQCQNISSICGWHATLFSFSSKCETNLKFNLKQYNRNCFLYIVDVRVVHV